MSKMSDAQKKAKKILEQMEGQSASHTEVNVESHSESSVTGGEVSSDQTAQVAELTNDLQRLQAEFANYKRRVESEKAEVAGFIVARTVREFLTVRDSFDNELTHRPENLDPAWAASIDTIRAQFDTVIKNLGVERFESVGQQFDPHLHEAIATDGEGETVTDELQPGYKLGEQILRHAMVRVGQDNNSEEK